MAYFTERKLKRINLPTNPEYWVDVVEEYKYGELKKFAEADKDGNIDFAMTADTFLLTAIKAWNLDDSAGSVLPITQENLDNLDKADAMAIIEAASAFAVEDDDSKKNSSK